MDVPHITSRQNPRVKGAVLLRNSRDRQRRGQFLVDGAREIGRAIASGIQCVEAFVCDDLSTSPDSQAAIRALKSTNAEILSVSPEVFAKLAFGDRNDGVIVVAETTTTRSKRN